jgi:hypothetical protein
MAVCTIEGCNEIAHGRGLCRRDYDALRSGRSAPVNKSATDPEAEALRRELALYKREWRSKPSWLTPPKDSKAHRGTLISFLTDCHYGEVVDPAELGDYNGYNIHVADVRTRRFFDRTITVARHYLHGVEYDGIVLALGGDLVSGTIHDELTETNELTTFETVEWAIPRLKAGIEKLAEEFGKVLVVSCPGNHGRMTKVPRFKNRSADNADTHIARLLALALDDEDAVSFEIPRSMDADFSVYGYNFSLEHGDAFKGGDGIIGSLGPIKRGTIKKQTQRALEGRPMDVNLLGHFHQYLPCAPAGFVCGGSLKGYDSYARGLHLKPEPPTQALMVVTPEHNVTVQAPLFVADRRAEKW